MHTKTRTHIFRARGLKYKRVNYVHMSKNLISENQARYNLSG